MEITLDQKIPIRLSRIQYWRRLESTMKMFLQFENEINKSILPTAVSTASHHSHHTITSRG